MFFFNLRWRKYPSRPSRCCNPSTARLARQQHPRPAIAVFGFGVQPGVEAMGVVGYFQGSVEILLGFGVAFSIFLALLSGG
jgi:hypothetical protein